MCALEKGLTGATDGSAKNRQLREYTIGNANTHETTNFGLLINNTNSLKAGLRGPTLLEDFQLREKIMHFDHERIPERVVHARGVGAHGYFQPYGDYSNITAAKFLRNPDTKTPVFVRFSTVLGSRGSADTVRDVRGFATRFYTEEGLFDLVGNDIPVFFIQDAIKFPDLIHAAKPEPDTEMPQAGTAHDTTYDFFSEFPESLHTVLWAFSGRGIPRSLRMMEGFGVHTFRLVNPKGKSVFVKWHWKPLQGLATLVWDEAQKIAGKDADFHRRDLYTAIDNGDYPEWELGVQIIPEEDEFKYDFDILDPTKIVPESLVPVVKIGKMTLNRNVDNYFAETEQVSFHLGHIVPGIDFTNDPLLQGRLFSYLDTQLNRHGSANFYQIPINRPINAVHNNQRDGFMQTTINKGKVAYYPNRMQGNSPQMASPEDGGFQSYNSKVDGPKVRGTAPSFFDYFSQPQLFYNSLTKAEQQQLVDAARFELGKTKSQSIRDRMIELLNNVDHDLAIRVAIAIGVTPPTKVTNPNKNRTSTGLSIEKYPKSNIRTRTVAILVADGVDASQVQSVYNSLKSKGAYPDIVAPHLGKVQNLNMQVNNTFVTTSSVLFDALYIPGGKKSVETLLGQSVMFPYAEPLEFIREAYRHGKPIAATGEGVQLIDKSGIPYNNKGSGVNDLNGVITSTDSNAGKINQPFANAILTARFWERMKMDPTKA
ncbi:catalase-domain-containing protein [Basidiobolus meristosporus CBS 931.73]|nr:catalase-domain-containing protein [Basidiobolus meristosporus CBS 931.73]|eukprot:ORX90139.1 catalase-domain-containing protein [Basidiobolus meristosporus CBS 931.73]